VTVLWKMSRVGGERARAVILPGGPPFTLAFFANDEMERIENYDSMDIVLFRANEIRQSLAKDGWSADESEDEEERRTKKEERKGRAS
jgi:hypothetical protein